MYTAGQFYVVVCSDTNHTTSSSDREYTKQQTQCSRW